VSQGFLGRLEVIDNSVVGTEKWTYIRGFELGHFLAARICCFMYWLLLRIQVLRSSGDCSRICSIGWEKIASCASGGSWWWRSYMVCMAWQYLGRLRLLLSLCKCWFRSVHVSNMYCQITCIKVVMIWWPAMVSVGCSWLMACAQCLEKWPW